MFRARAVVTASLLCIATAVALAGAPSASARKRCRHLFEKHGCAIKTAEFTIRSFEDYPEFHLNVGEGTKHKSAVQVFIKPGQCAATTAFTASKEQFPRVGKTIKFHNKTSSKGGDYDTVVTFDASVKIKSANKATGKVKIHEVRTAHENFAPVAPCDLTFTVALDRES